MRAVGPSARRRIRACHEHVVRLQYQREPAQNGREEVCGHLPPADYRPAYAPAPRTGRSKTQRRTPVHWDACPWRTARRYEPKKNCRQTMIFMGVSRVKPEKCASAPGHASCRRAVSHRPSCARSAPRPPRVGELDEVALCGGAARDDVAEHIRTAAARSIEPRTRKHFLARACNEEARRTHLRSVLDERARPARGPPAACPRVLRGHRPATRPLRPGSRTQRPAHAPKESGAGRGRAAAGRAGRRQHVCSYMYRNLRVPRCSDRRLLNPLVRPPCRSRSHAALFGCGASPASACSCVREVSSLRALVCAELPCSPLSVTVSIWCGGRGPEACAHALGMRRCRNDGRGQSVTVSSTVCSEQAAGVLTARRVVVGCVQTARSHGLARRIPMSQSVS